MALDLPTSAELQQLEDDDLDQDTALQMAADLFTMATGIQDTPTDEFQARLIHNALLEMAWALRVRHGDQEAVFSPFSGERIGSYSYQKAQQSISQGSKTGVPFFDAAVAWFNKKARTAQPSTTSEWVFEQGCEHRWAGEDLYRRQHSEDPSFWLRPL